MELSIPFGRTALTIRLPDHLDVDCIEPSPVPAARHPSHAVQTALDQCIGGRSWNDYQGARSAAIAINDKTRPIPHEVLLPPLLKKLKALGIPEEAIVLYIAVGSHPPMSAAEFPAILPAAIHQRYAVVSHDAFDEQRLDHLGTTQRGTPIFGLHNFLQSDLKIVVGAIEPHQFVGFSGGVKTAAIGLAGAKSINANHAMMIDPQAALAEYDTNPVRQDIEEIGDRMGVHLALNAILNHEREIVEVLAGDPLAVMEAGIPIARRISQVAVHHKYDAVIASPGGHPKDLNVYQAQKALAHAARVTKPGGTILLAAACTEGAGSPHYQEWMEDKTTPSDVLAQFKAIGFQVGPHKAFLIARDASRFQIMTYTSMDEALAKKLLLNPIPDLQEALDGISERLKPDARLAVLRYASSIVPELSRRHG